MQNSPSALIASSSKIDKTKNTLETNSS